MKMLLGFVCCLPLLAACSVNVETDPKTGDFKRFHISVAGSVENAGKRATETRTVAAFDTLESTGSIDCDVTIGDKPQLVVEGDENLIKRIKTEVSGNTLRISTAGDMHIQIFSGQSDGGLRVHIVTPRLIAASHTGSGDLKVSGLKDSDFSYSSTGSGDATLSGTVGKFTAHLTGSGNLDAKSLMPTSSLIEVLGSGDVSFGELASSALDLSIHGSGSVTATGVSKQVNAKIMGSGNADLGGLEADEGDLEVWGSGDMSLKVEKRLTASTHGSGTITIHGKPEHSEVHGKNVEFEES